LVYGTKKELFDKTGKKTVHDAFLELAEKEKP
jgi:hypothetical protein